VPRNWIPRSATQVWSEYRYRCPDFHGISFEIEPNRYGHEPATNLSTKVINRSMSVCSHGTVRPDGSH
jgi:hypothetical protein